MSRESLWAYYHDDDVPLYQHTEDTELAVLMQEAPFGDNGGVSPARLVREDIALGDDLFAVVEEILTEREQYVLSAWTYERLGVRAIGVQLSLSKSQVHRILQGALKKLRLQLSRSPAVQSWLEDIVGTGTVASASAVDLWSPLDLPGFELESGLEADHV